jgi:hypothetical protein
MRSLVQLSVRGPAGRVEATALETSHEGDTLYLCGRGECPHWGGQAGLFGRTNDFVCLLTGARPAGICQPFYVEAAEDLDAVRRSVLPRLESDPDGLRRELLDRLEAAEHFETTTQQLAREAGL